MGSIGARLAARVTVLALLSTLVLPVSAYAATFAGEYPVGALNRQPTLVQVTAFSAVAFDTRTPKIKVDGVSYTTLFYAGSASGYWRATEYFDPVLGVWKIRWTWVPTTADPNKTTLYSYPVFASPLGDGTHTVVATIKDKAGVTSTDTWTFSYQASPTLGAPTPSDGSTVATVTPVISVPVSDNGPGALTATATVNGVVATATASGGVVRVTPPVLPNDATATVAVTASDAAGNKTTKTWSFWVEIYPEMASAVGECLSCHPDAPADNDMGSDCSLCHAPPQESPHTGAPASFHARADVSACTPCHVSDITVEHARGGLTCLTCHQSTDPAVVAAIASHQTACPACHPGATHPDADAKHEAAVVKCIGSGCHSGQLPDLHGSQCSGCHTTAGVEACITCHPGQIDTNGDVIPHAFDPAKHIGNDTVGPPDPRPKGCSDRTGIQSGCHDIGNVATLHDGVIGGSCAVCHGSGKTPSTNCRSCHPAGATDPAPGVLAGTLIYHHLNVKYLNDRSDAPADAHYFFDPDFAYHLQPQPPSGWNDALSQQDCWEYCHKDAVGPGTPPFSGSKMWYSLGSVDPYPFALAPPRTLTRSITLPSEPTTLTFKAMWALEYWTADYDYQTGHWIDTLRGTDSVVVQVSTDGGGTWDPLAGDMGGGASNPATGTSAGWRDASFDLSAFAGQTVQVRFLYAPVYIPSDYVVAGWAIDDIAITGASGAVFGDGAETLDPGWANGGWVRVGEVFGF
jgi:hypothetical protein